METKLVEIRDRFTAVYAVATELWPGPVEDEDAIRRMGWNPARRPYPVVLYWPSAKEGRHDPLGWGESPRTMRVAHEWIEGHWDELRSSDVVDVEWILGERDEPKRPQREDAAAMRAQGLAEWLEDACASVERQMEDALEAREGGEAR